MWNNLHAPLTAASLKLVGGIGHRTPISVLRAARNYFENMSKLPGSDSFVPGLAV